MLEATRKRTRVASETTKMSIEKTGSVIFGVLVTTFVIWQCSNGDLPWQRAPSERRVDNVDLKPSTSEIAAAPVGAIAREPQAKISPGFQELTKDQFGEHWPFNVPKVVIGCGELSATLSNGTPLWSVYVEAGTRKYALNGTAKPRAKQLGWDTRIEKIAPGGTAGIVIDAALKTCESEPWYVGGSLHGGSAADWRRATTANKLATAADIVATAQSSNLLAQSIARLLEGPESVKPLAVQVVIGLDKAFEPGAKQVDADTKVASVAAMLMLTMGWLKSD
jgi:hypothetical protein